MTALSHTYISAPPSGLRQIQLSVPGAYEKPQPLQPTMKAGLPGTFTFHVNPVLSPKLNIELQEKFQVLHVSELWQGRAHAGGDSRAPGRYIFQPTPAPRLSSLQSGPSDELEAQTCKMDKANILLSSLPLNQELTKLVDLEEVRFSVVLGTPACPCERSGAHTGQLPEH